MTMAALLHQALGFALRPFTLAASVLRGRFRSWWQARLNASDTLQLTQRNIYILPTRAGLMFALTLLVLLVASINYQLNLGYVLTFLLAGSGLVSMHLTHNTLRGLTLHLRPPPPSFAGEPARLDIVLGAPSRERYGIGLRFESAAPETLGWTDVAAGGQSAVQLAHSFAQRGEHAVPLISVETRFPLGLFRAWSVWKPASAALVYPAPEHPAHPLPSVAAPVTSGDAHARRVEGGETEGVRTYRRGDPLKWVVWKKAARALESGGDLVSRDTRAAVHQMLWLDWQQCAPLAPEPRLSRLAAWVLAAERAGADYGLRMPGHEIAPAHGDAQERRCLEALARWN